MDLLSSTGPAPRRPAGPTQAPRAAPALHRYAAVAGDAQAFFDAAASPLPRVVWPNTLRPRAAETLARVVGARCAGGEPLSWWPGAWRLPPDSEPGRWPEFATGLYHCQEEASLLAVWALDPQPGERVLDLCAAPGGKTALCAVRMGDRGLVIANDSVLSRLVALGDTLARLGLTSVVVTRCDGRSFPAPASPFDRVLVDAPCSCEGNSRKQGGRLPLCSPAKRDGLVRIQRALLCRALELVRPGGVVVYSTCTYAPEENEAVVAHAVASTPGVRIEHLAGPRGLRTSGGLVRWGEAHWPTWMEHAVRLWPHRSDTGGFFLARLRRV